MAVSELLDGLRAARKITRGPKPARALHEIGLPSDLPAPVPTSRGVIDALAKLDLAGRRVGVQLYGSDPGRELVARGRGGVPAAMAEPSVPVRRRAAHGWWGPAPPGLTFLAGLAHTRAARRPRLPSASLEHGRA